MPSRCSATRLEFTETTVHYHLIPASVQSRLEELQPSIAVLTCANRQLHYANSFSHHPASASRLLQQLLDQIDTAYRLGDGEEKIKGSQSLLRQIVVPAIEGTQELLQEQDLEMKTEITTFDQQFINWLDQRRSSDTTPVTSSSVLLALPETIATEMIEEDTAILQIKNVQTATEATARMRQLLIILQQKPIYHREQRQIERENKRNAVLRDAERQLEDLESNLLRRCGRATADPLDTAQALLLTLRALRKGHVAALLNQNYLVRELHLVYAGVDGNRSLEYSQDLALLSNLLQQGYQDQTGVDGVPDLMRGRWSWIPQAYRQLKNPAYQLYHKGSVNPDGFEQRLRELYNLIDQQGKATEAMEGWSTVIEGEALNSEEVAERAAEKAQAIEESYLFEALVALQQLIYRGFPRVDVPGWM